ncbi:TetR/AcrR family transcriptional regulator [Sphingobium sp. TKS]|uniref:TetR/AcrR family transcriptional regulator n=2 Tax=unclassified Sphingobium TaxID=2611147 RepID=UPI0007706C6D|nr:MULTISPECIES: TetR/AcrR family transcriptional regulator [Sphingomonadaceae]AMK22743.1 TetR family transcriptional regulator [Sphingobium sp. TKS]
MNQASAAQEDHRVTFARARRERMRSRLLQATFDVYTADRGINDPAVIDDVIRAAGVSRATFYKYFSSLEEAAAELGHQLADEMVRVLDPIQDPLTEPLIRASVGIQFFLWRAVDEPNWGNFVARSRHVVSETSPFMRRVTGDVDDLVRAGVLSFARLDAAVTFNNGALMNGISTISQGVERPAEFIESLTIMMLCGFGATQDSAIDGQKRGSDFLRRTAPSHYEWWRAHR